MADILLNDSVEPNGLITPATPLVETPRNFSECQRSRPGGSTRRAGQTATQQEV